MCVYNLCCVLSLKQHSCKRWWTTQSSTERSKMLPAKAPTSNLLLIYIKLKSRNKKFNLFVSVTMTKMWGDDGKTINLHKFLWNEFFSTDATNFVESFVKIQIVRRHIVNFPTRQLIRQIFAQSFNQFFLLSLANSISPKIVWCKRRKIS